MENQVKKYRASRISEAMDLDNGVLIVKRENLNKYFDRYFCTTEKELSEKLWFDFGICLQLV